MTGHPCPRAGGDGPSVRFDRGSVSGCSLRSRGWPPGLQHLGRLAALLPAHAGVVPCTQEHADEVRAAPRACGDGPSVVRPSTSPQLCSPRVRGWSLHTQLEAGVPLVLPARAGRVPRAGTAERSEDAASRTFGGWAPDRVSPRPHESLRPGEWPLRIDALAGGFQLLPALAGMVPQDWGAHPRATTAPRTCGDDPKADVYAATRACCSPPARGWSRRAAACPRGLLSVRGDGSW